MGNLIYILSTEKVWSLVKIVCQTDGQPDRQRDNVLTTVVVFFCTDNDMEEGKAGFNYQYQ